jgi:Predicted membrane protein (DUF2142)
VNADQACGCISVRVSTPHENDAPHPVHGVPEKTARETLWMLDGNSRFDRPRFLAAVFLVFGMLTTALLSTAIPPFQNADEPNHFSRASQISDGALIGYRIGPGSSGGLVDTAISAACAPFHSVPFHADVKVTQSMYDQAGQARWGGPLAEAPFSNTAVYPPLLYLPSVAAIKIGRIKGSPVIHTLYLARAFTGISTAIIAAIAISIAGSAALWLFVLLTLPMATSQMIALSQDGLILALSSLAVAMVAPRLRERRPMPIGLFNTVCAIIVVVGSARPPYAALALVLLAAANLTWRRRVAGLLTVVLLILSWAIFAAAYVATFDLRTDVQIDPMAQAKFILGHPLDFVPIIARSISHNWNSYLVSFTGQLGWLDVALPWKYHQAACAVLILAAVASSTRENATSVSPSAPLIALTAGALVLTAIGIFLIQYLAWTGVGAAMVEGIMGRYFIPPAMFAILAMPLIFPSGRWTKLATAIVVLFPFGSLAVVMHALISRYYLG